jgi:hypothetical protein
MLSPFFNRFKLLFPLLAHRSPIAPATTTPPLLQCPLGEDLGETYSGYGNRATTRYKCSNTNRQQRQCRRTQQLRAPPRPNKPANF